MKKIKLRLWHSWSVILMIGITSFSSIAQTTGDINKYNSTEGNSKCKFFDGYIDNGDGTVTDPRNGLVWKRCMEGFEWSGSTCTGKKMETTWVESIKIAKNSRFAGKNDWRIPSKEEFETVLGKILFVNSIGYGSGGCYENDFQNYRFAASNVLTSGLEPRKRANDFWTSTRLGDPIHYPDSYRNYVYFAGFSDGQISHKARRGEVSGVRLVRVNDATSNVAVSEFTQEYAIIELEMKREEEERVALAKRQAEERVAEAKRQAEERAAEAKRIAYEKSPAGRAEARRRANEIDRTQRSSGSYGGGNTTVIDSKLSLRYKEGNDYSLYCGDSFVTYMTKKGDLWSSTFTMTMDEDWRVVARVAGKDTYSCTHQ